MAAAAHYKLWSPDSRCGLNGLAVKALGPSATATAAWSQLHSRATPRRTCSINCSSKARRGYRRASAKACAALLSAERAARAARRGIWADPNFAPLSAENVAGLQAERGRFALVEGKVLSVRESGATIYTNFGRRWMRDFIVTILRRLQRAFAAAGVESQKLEGRRIRVRGWIEQRGGPIIAAEAPEQIEFAD